MHSANLRIEMLGEFSLRQGAAVITDQDNRSHKVWLLLAYMICCRGRTVTQDDLVDLLWSDGESSSNPLNALKTMFHRVRTTLNQLEPDAGHQLIIRKGGNYAWNPEVKFTFDVEEFEALVRRGSAAEDEDRKLEAYQKALALYKGDFLPRLDFSPWVMPLSAFFHNLYLETVLETLPLLEGRDRLEEAVELCRSAIAIDPYSEPVYQHLMQELLDLGRQQEVGMVYEAMSRQLFETFSVMPSDESLAIYRKAIQTTNDRALSLVTLQDQLREPEGTQGALLCDYDFFKLLYRAQARALGRSGDAAHIALLSVTGENLRELPRRSLDCCMDNLRQLIQDNLSRSDVASRCSVSQYIFLLPHISYEGSCQVCEELVKAFCRQYPHSPARLHYVVQPLTPEL